MLAITMPRIWLQPQLTNISWASIRRTNVANRTLPVPRLKDQFNSNDVALTEHWDGKLLPDITGHATVDRLPALVSGHGIEQLLGVPKLNHGTASLAKNQQCCYSSVEGMGLTDRVKATCFDTTASNTGCRAGACWLIENKHLLALACRQLVNKAISEGISTAAFKALSRHLWYICEELIALVFFESNTSNATKRKMVDSLQHPGSNEPPKRIQIQLN
jgi:hypothetical protein